MDPKSLEKAITPKTKAILPVHLYGQPCDIEGIMAIAKAKGIPVIEDCAQSIGAKVNGKQTGTFGLVNATSFYPGKNLGAWGEGGACMTDDVEIAARIRRLRDHAQQGRHNHTEIGYNWRLDGFQGAVLSIKLKHLDKWNARRREIAAKYLPAFRNLPGVSVMEGLPGTEPIWHIFPIFHAKRDEFRAALEKYGVQSGVHYPKPVHLQPAYAHLGVKAGSLPVSERLTQQEISLPMFPELTDEQADKVVEVVTKVAKELA
jgi:dTDP-4-amino-4,6-dideoxygalactose transaminase